MRSPSTFASYGCRWVLAGVYDSDIDHRDAKINGHAIRGSFAFAMIWFPAEKDYAILATGISPLLSQGFSIAKIRLSFNPVFRDGACSINIRRIIR